MAKANVWKVTGYRGRNDYDGPADDNTSIEVIFDSHFNKEDVETIMFNYWNKQYRSVAIKAELIETKDMIEERETTMQDRRELSKIVKVSDPEMWYGQKTATVKLFICPPYEGKTDVRIMVESIDDFAMEYTRECYGQKDINYTYDRMKQYMFDAMPKTINCRWLGEHGYFPF
jgi:hypothetical protein